MDKINLRNEIKELIEDIKNHSDGITDTDAISQLELEAILHKIEKLFQKSIVFNYLHSFSDKQPKLQPNIDQKQQESDTSLSIESVGTNLTEKDIEKLIEKEEVKKAEEIVVSPTDLLGGELPKAVENVKEEKKTETKEEATSAKKGVKTAVTDMKAAIGINDKFQYINELFHGNAQEYIIAIQHFNDSENLESAMEYFYTLQKLYNWEDESSTTKRLLNLIERRYS
ncbi:MAG: hypothetical protein WCP52_09075 [Bacteroidota bacterium]